MAEFLLAAAGACLMHVLHAFRYLAGVPTLRVRGVPDDVPRRSRSQVADELTAYDPDAVVLVA
jgi:hypothetical protein